MALQNVQIGTGNWKYDLFDCFDECGLCLLTWVFPWYTFGMNADKVGENCFLCGGALFLADAAYVGVGCPLYSCLGMSLRGKIRGVRGINGGACSDCCIYLFCTPCAIVQEARELRAPLEAAVVVVGQPEGTNLPQDGTHPPAGAICPPPGAPYPPPGPAYPPLGTYEPPCPPYATGPSPPAYQEHADAVSKHPDQEAAVVTKQSTKAESIVTKQPGNEEFTNIIPKPGPDGGPA